MDETIVNRVTKSPLVTLELEKYYHSGERILIDLKEILFQGMILREKDFREWAKTHDWSQYKDKNVAVHCTADAIIPTWAYMLIATKAEAFCNMIVQGDLDRLETMLFHEAISKIDLEDYKDKMVVVKGCSKVEVPASAYLEISRKLYPISKSIMYGEPCSTVPVYKRPKKQNS